MPGCERLFVKPVSFVSLYLTIPSIPSLLVNMPVDQLKDIELHDHEGNAVQLGSLWKTKTAILVWVRHFG